MTNRHLYSIELKELWRLAAPLAAVHAGNQLMGFVDTAVVGRLGAAPLGATGLGHALFFAFAIVGMGTMMGLDPLVAQALGAGDGLRARKLLWQATWLALAITALLTVPLLLLVPMLELFGIGPDVAALTRPYLLLRILGLAPVLLFVGIRSYLQSLGITRPLVLAMIAANIFNLVVTILLVHGGSILPPWAGPLRELPAFGVSGAAAATTACALLQLGLGAWAVRLVASEGFLPAMRRPEPAELRHAFRVGLPIGLQMGAEVGIFTLVAVLAGRLGAGPLAAHQIALTLVGFTFTVSLGVGAAGSVRVGKAIGAGDTSGARRAGLIAFASSAAFMALSAIVFWIFPTELARLITDKTDVIAAAAPLIIVAAFFQLSDGIQAVGSGVLRGAGDTRFSFIANVAGHYGVGVPIAVALGLGMSMGVVGLWWGLCGGLTAVAVTLFVRFLRLSARPIRPLERTDELLPPELERASSR